jgi:hypothetical protein
MTSPSIWFVCPFSRPEYASNVWDNYVRQSHGRKRLIVVENGAGLGKFKGVGIDRRGLVILHTGKIGVSAAKNVALDWLARHDPDAVWSTFDDDDIYWHSYATEVAHGASMGAALWGKASWYVHPVERHELWLLADQEPQAWASSVHGATISGWVRDGWRFDETLLQGEDMDLCRRVLEAGGKIWSTSRNHYAWIRRNGAGHTYPARDHDIMRRFTVRGLTRYPLDWRLIEGRGFYTGTYEHSYYSRRLSSSSTVASK